MNKILAQRGEPYNKKNWTKIKIENMFLQFLNNFPFLKKTIIHIRQIIKINQFKRKSKKIKTNKNNFDIEKIYWINPKKIQYASLKEFDIFANAGKFIRGDWDLLERPFEDLDVCIAFKERFIEGKQWDMTIFYQRILKEINAGKFLWGCKNKNDFDLRLQGLETLYQEIKNNGYKTQNELHRGKNLQKIEEEISINIGRHGDLLFNDGAHRLAIAKILNLKKIPVKITVRHPEWIKFRKEIFLFARDQNFGVIYQPITHIDLKDIPSYHEIKIDRFKIIKDNISVKKGHLLDIGSHWGYFCHKFEDIEFDCYAIEIDHTNVYFMEKLKRAENKNFKIIPKSIFDAKEIQNINFDIVLALNIFHHFLKTESQYQQLIQFLNSLKVKELFFEPYNPCEKQMENSYKNYNEEEFIQFIQKHSCLKNVKFLGDAQDKRRIYKLY